MDLTEAIDSVWKKVRKKYFYPALDIPVQGKESKSGKPIDTAAIVFDEKRMVYINPDFAYNIEKLGMRLDDAVEAILDHEIAHNSYCPRDFSKYLEMHSEMLKVMKDDAAKLNSAINYYMDAIVNTHNVREKETKIPELYKTVYGSIKDHDMETIMGMMYQEIWNMDLGVTKIADAESALLVLKKTLEDKDYNFKKTDPSDKSYDSLSNEIAVLREAAEKKERLLDAAKTISEIPYLDKENWDKNSRVFAKAVKEFIKEDPQMGSEGLDQFSEDEIKKGIRDYAQKSDPRRFGEVMKSLEETMDNKKGECKLDRKKMGKGSGNYRDYKSEFYQRRAEKYTIPIEGTPLRKSGSLFPETHSKWEVGENVGDIDYWNSYGKILPGITQKWNRSEGETHFDDEAVPDCVLIIDSSGSMPDPGKVLSQAVLGAGAAADAYLRRGSKVAVYNFSDAMSGNELVLDFSDDREKIYNSLCVYYGGGTSLKHGTIEKIRANSENADVFIMTDMQITNLDSILKYFEGFSGRVTAVHVGANESTEKFQEAFGGKKNVSIYRVDMEDDIAKVVVGKIKKDFGMGGGL